MKRTVTLISLLLLASAFVLPAQDKTYYVSPDGNDAASGLSVKEAWKSIAKINSVTFQPGDKILLQSGRTFPGQIILKGSGTPEKPILLSSFGGTVRPVIDMGREDGNAITLTDASGWEIIGLEITSGYVPEVGVGRSGIVVNASGAGVAYKHLVIKDNYIHDVWGQMGGTRGRNAAISVSVSGPRRTPGTTPQAAVEPTTFDDVLIEGNRIERVDKVGITTSGLGGLRVRRNWMDNLGGDGIIVSGSVRALIEFNEIHRSCMRSGMLDLPGDTAWNEGRDGWWPHTAACWIIRCEETIMQFNEVYDTGRQIRNGDGFAYDFDFYCKNCLCQYNYSKENHGFLLLMYDIFQNTARYNISENDKTHLVQMQGSLKNDSNFLYNNVFYVDHGTLDLDFFRGDFAESAKDINDLGAHFYNNIFYAAGQGRFRWEYSTGLAWERTFDGSLRPSLPAGSIFLHNCYFGPWLGGMPDDPEALVADPKFVAPGTGGTGLGTLGGYMLRPDSPCINTGMYVPNAGDRDFFGGALVDGHPDFGAFEAVGTGVFADKADLAARDKAAADAASVAWSKWCFPLGLPVEPANAVTVRLYRPVEEGVGGTLTWENPKGGKPVVVQLDKLKDRSVITLPLKSDAQTLLSSKVKVHLQKGSFTEDFEIPFSEKPATRR